MPAEKSDSPRDGFSKRPDEGRVEFDGTRPVAEIGDADAANSTRLSSSNTPFVRTD